MIPQVGFVISWFAAGTPAVTLERAGLVTVDANGIATAASPTTLSIKCLAIPEGRRLQRLPEGDRTPDRRDFYLSDAGIVVQGARASGSDAARAPDVLIELGVRWVVQVAHDWSPAGYRLVECVREGV